MTTIEASTDERTAKIAGLRELADFLDGHPDVPLPYVGIWSTAYDRAALLSWIDGLDALRIEPGTIDTYRDVVRTFDGLDVPLTAKAEHLGEVRTVPSTTTELVPFTADEIRERAVQS